MREIRAMHLLFAKRLPDSGQNLVTNCGKTIPFKGFVSREMVDSRLCKECVDKIDGHAVLSAIAQECCFAVVEYGEEN